MNKIKRAIENPGYAFHVIVSRVMRINMRAKVFSHAKE